MAQLQVDLVGAEEVVWAGKAREVSARTTDGDIGILAGHTPLLAAVVPGEVHVTGTDGQKVTAVVEDGGFLSVEHDRVSLVAGSLHVK